MLLEEFNVSKLIVFCCYNQQYDLLCIDNSNLKKKRFSCSVVVYVLLNYHNMCKYTEVLGRNNVNTFYCSNDAYTKIYFQTKVHSNDKQYSLLYFASKIKTLGW